MSLYDRNGKSATDGDGNTGEPLLKPEAAVRVHRAGQLRAALETMIGGSVTSFRGAKNDRGFLEFGKPRPWFRS